MKLIHGIHNDRLRLLLWQISNTKQYFAKKRYSNLICALFCCFQRSFKQPPKIHSTEYLQEFKVTLSYVRTCKICICFKHIFM